MKNKLLFLFWVFLFPLAGQAQLSGNYTINPAGLPAPPNFISFSAAVSALTSQGVSGNVVFTVSSATYTETFTVTNIPGTGPNARVTFQSAGGPDNCIISFNTSAGGIAVGAVNLRGAKYVSFKGITVRNFQPVANSAALHIFAGDGAGTYDVRAEYLSFDNCRFLVDTTATTGRFGVLIANNNAWAGYTRPILAHALSFKKCLFKGGTNGLGLLTSGTANWYGSPVDSISIDSCEAVLQYSYGIELWGAKNASVTNSRIHDMRSGNGAASALRFYQSLEFNVRGNYIICGHRIGLEINHSGSPALGISYVVNNYISGGGSNASGYFTGSKNVRYYHNTFKSLASGGVGVDFNGTIVDNEFVNNIVEAGTTSNVNVFNSPSTAGGFTALDYNVYYGANGGTVRFFWGSNLTDLAAWQTAAPLFNVHSVFGATTFAANSPEITDPLTARTGTNLGITQDIFGRPRGAAPTIGAYESASLPVPPQPAPFIVKTDTVCNPPVNNIRYTINAVPGATGYEWETLASWWDIGGAGPGNKFTGGANDTSVLISFLASAGPGNLIVRAKNAAGAGPDRTTPVAIRTTPVQPGTFTTSSASVCQGQNGVTYTVPNVPGVSYNWSYSGTGAAITGSGNSVSVNFNTAATGGSLEVTATNSCGTSAARSLSVTVNLIPGQPAAFTTSSPVVCQGQSGVVYIVPNVANVTYSWAYSGTGATINGSGNNVTVDFSRIATGGILSVTATNSCGTGTARDISVTVNPLPVVTVTPPAHADICEGDTATLTAAGTGSSYSWKDGTGAAVHNGPIYKATATGDYYVVSATPNSCRDSSAQYMVTVHARPDVHITIPANDTSFCAGGTITIYAIPADTGLAYRWKSGNDDIPNALSFFLERTTSGVYSVVVSRMHVAGCTDSSDPVTVTVHPLPVPVIVQSGDTLRTGAAYAIYQWNVGGQPVPGATNAVYVVPANGSYTVTVTDTNGCSNISGPVEMDHVSIGSGDLPGREVKVYPNPAADIVYIQAPVQVHATLTGMDGKVLIQCPDARRIDISGLPDGVYLLQVTTPDGYLLKHERLLKSGR